MGSNGEMTGETTLVEEHLRPAHDAEWLDGVLDALRQSAKQAHLDAFLTGTGVVVHVDGKVRVIAPDPAMYEDLIPPPYVEEPLKLAP